MIVLASASPRRRDILLELGVNFSILTADTDESCDLVDPRALTRELAERKGLAVYELLKAGEGSFSEEPVIISADTVVYADGEILGKPRDEEDAVRMLKKLSGGTHTVVSGVAVTVNGVSRSAASVTEVRVDDIPESELIRYAKSGEPMDKAGAYAIQGRFSPWIRSIDGCYFNVVGLPVNCLNKLFFECTGKYLV